MLEYIIFSYFGLGLFTVALLSSEAWDYNPSSLQREFKRNPKDTLLALLGFVFIWPILLYFHRNK